MRSVHRHLFRTSAVLAAGTLIAAACAKVPYTGRKAFNAMPRGTMLQMGASTYQQMLVDVPVVTSGPEVAALRRVGSHISAVADQPDYAWEFALIDDPQVNAWCLPGGKIGFYTGILPVLESEAGMAFVMGHEVGHAVARHSGERMTQQLGLSGAITVVDMILAGTGKVTDEQRALTMGALGLGAQVGVVLPFSRSHEIEADVIGLMYMAEAGYPPRQGVKVWERMDALSGGAQPAAFLSTHPTHSKRIANLEEWMPRASKTFRRGDTRMEGSKEPIF